LITFEIVSMNSSIQEKIYLEHEAARLFMRFYEKQTGIPMRHIWHNLPRKPDVSCYLNDSKLDLEIAHIYGSEAEPARRRKTIIANVYGWCCVI